MDAPAGTIDALLLDIDALDAYDGDGSLRARVARLIAAFVGVGLLTQRSVSDLDGALEGLVGGPGPVLLATESGAQLYDVHDSGTRPRRPPSRPGAWRSLPPAGQDAWPDHWPDHWPDAWPDGGWHLLLAELQAHGVPTANVLLLGAPGQALPTGVPGRAVPLADAPQALDEQLRRRELKRVPQVTDDPAWTVVDAGSPRRRPGAQAALFTIGDGTIVTRGVIEEDPGSAAVLAAGVYIGSGSKQHLRPGPGWTALELSGPTREHRRVLDLKTGVLLRDQPTAGDPAAKDPDGAPPLRTLRFASAVRPGVQVLRAEGSRVRLRPGAPLQPPAEGELAAGRTDGVAWCQTVGDVGGITAVAVQDIVDDGGYRAVERLAAYRGQPRRSPNPKDIDDAIEALSDAARIGFDGLLAEHRREWARRWSFVNVEIPDDPAAQQAFRFALFQLWTNVGCPVEPTGEWSGEERAVGARGLSGQGYAGHVFWDADIFVLPAMATICPAAARAMVEYRIRRLPLAHARAAAEGHAGARFPWESAREGVEVTPSTGVLGKEIMQIRTGELEEHIMSDVAWAADRYAVWTGDLDVLGGPARPLIIETARYWASRITRTRDGRGHINEVIGPDEYHEGVDDNAFTNIMARWNLRRAADLLGDADEARQWREMADAIVDGYDPATRRHEQFAGYLALEPLLVTGIAPLPFAADLVLGRQRVWQSQLLKQADVLMAHFLVPDELPAGSMLADLSFYVPRTSHGSSLSPAITAALLARVGRPDEGLETLRMALRLDLDDITGSSTGGLHLATIGGTWAALVEGFLGLAVRDGVLHADPHLPSAWRTIRVRLRVLGARIELDVGPDRLTFTTDRPLRLRPAGTDAVQVVDTATFERHGERWRPARFHQKPASTRNR